MFFRFKKSAEPKLDKKQNQKPEHNRSDNVGLLIGGNILLIAIIGALIVLFGLRINAIFSPILLFVLIIAMLLPLLRFGWAKALMFALSAIFLLWFLKNTASVLTPFILAAIIAYLMYPLVLIIEGRFRKISHSAAVIIAFVPLLLIVGGLFALVIPLFIREGSTFLANLRTYVSGIEGTLVRIMTALNEFLIRNNFPPVAQFADIQDNFLTNNVVAIIERAVSSFFANMTQGLGMFVTVVLYVVVTPILSLYILLDYRRFRGIISRYIPRAHEFEIRNFIIRSERVVHDYLGGMVLASAIIGLVFYLMFLIAGVKYGLLLGIIRGVFNMLPLVGGIVVVPTFIIAAFSADQVLWVGALKVGIIYAIGQILDSWVVTPMVLGGKLKLPPVFIVLSIILCGYFFHFVGIIIAVPIAGVVNLAFRKLQANYLRSRFYRGTDI
ncbi:MAG: AI-2E family transporter [Spirochaetes bacterium]|nr:AI-2E family transporter [Spirochaetota bacterium]